MRYEERATLEEVQRRREQVINYLETVILPNDERLQKVIESLKAQLLADRVGLTELNQPIISSSLPLLPDVKSGSGVGESPRNLSSYGYAPRLANVSV